jgi:hypothetical protein
MQPSKNHSRRTVLHLNLGRFAVSRRGGVARYTAQMRYYLCLASMLAACSGELPGRVQEQPAAALTTPAAKSELHATVQRLTSHEVAQVTVRPDGTRITPVQGMSQVIVAKTNPDGSVTAKCVESADDGFLQDVK